MSVRSQLMVARTCINSALSSLDDEPKYNIGDMLENDECEKVTVLGSSFAQHNDRRYYCYYCERLADNFCNFYWERELTTFWKPDRR